MKVLHINTSDTGSGGAIAGYRLYQGLLAQGVDSQLLVNSSNSVDDRIAVIPSNNTQEKLSFKIAKYISLNYINVINTFKLPQHPFFKQAQIINFHNLHGGYFNYLAIPKLTESKPAVLTLHDMWSFTGHCVYSFDCNRWKVGCGHCPYLDIYPAINKDTTNLEWKLKNWVYNRSNLVIVTLSNWLTEQAKQSILNRFPINHIPNGIDTQAYQPINSELCRHILGIPDNKKVIMFAAQSLADSRKGGDLLLKALQSLPESLKQETILLTLGSSGEAITKDLGMQAMNLGYVQSDRLKSIAYSAADLFVFPTRADNLPLVLQESMACGTPMVSFKVGGVPDLVRPGVTGYLAEPESAKDLCKNMVELLEDFNLRDRMSQQCREIALKEYSLELQAQRYIDLYSQTLASSC
ncbi:glycosyltransferase family 4 protein [Moorena bouillonii]|uniref:Glycosyl transferase n=1 Tax=Moorena bouillonii PNG TaxID=568701 RepID=A0A1U7N5J7_9CYAN|nr:glycosyltransferase family 4 protein [Moorena bouillonii]OLT61230.1 glycosyl transferase [Moorena bouillonii PNG]